MDPLANFSQEASQAINNLKENIKSLRTGRASPSLAENLIVEAYGGQTKLKLMELSTITTEGPQALSIIPFDPSVLADIEKAVLKSPLGISPIVQGNRLLLRFPPLSQEQREKILKLVNQVVEEKKQTIRGFRDEARKTIKTGFEKKEITEDKKFRLEKEIDNLTQKYMEEIETIKKNKSREVMEI